LKLKKKVVLFICLIFSILSISGCEVSEEKKSIYYDNSKITQDGDSFTYKTRIGTKESSEHSKVKYSGFYGADTIWTIESKENSEITFKYNSEVNSGEFKAVLINPKKEIENIITGNEQGEKTIKITEGEYVFKFVGDEAKGEAEIFISKNGNINIEEDS